MDGVRRAACSGRSVASDVGEAGAIASPPALINAIIDALSPLGVTDMSMPATPQKVWKAIQDSQSVAAE